MNNLLYKKIEKLAGIKNSDILDKKLIPPRRTRGKSEPHFNVPMAGMIHQADLLRLPTDKGFKYALVVVDLGNRACDAEPMKTTKSSETVQAIKKIYKRPYLSLPKLMMINDGGSEFKKYFKKYLENNGIIQKVGLPYRSRQQAVVERYNYVISRAISRYQIGKEILTDKKNTEWIKYLPYITKVMNEFLTINPKVKLNKPHCRQKTGDCDLLEKGLKVRRALDKPIDTVTGKRLPDARWRVGDIRWSPKIYTIESIRINSNQPPLYKLEGIKNATFTKAQLQVVDENEPIISYPDVKNKYIIEKFLKKRKTPSNLVEILVKWKNYPKNEATWELRKNLIEDVGKEQFNIFNKMLK